jgi:hypothetical protein
MSRTSAFKSIYMEFMETPPPPTIEAKLPDLTWRWVWGRLAQAGLPALLVDVGFSYLHNILPLQVRRHWLSLSASPACLRCGAAVEDVLHFFTACPRVAEAWEALLFAATRVLGPTTDRKLLFLAFPPAVAERHVVLAVLAFVELAWSTRDTEAALLPREVRARVKVLAKGEIKTIFEM